MKKKDIILFIIVILITVISFGVKKYFELKTATNIEIYVDNSLYKKIPIDSNEEISIKKNGHTNVIKIHDNGVEMISADCPDKVCVKTGFIDKTGESIVCLPNKISIKIVSNEDKEIDVTVK